MNVTNSMMYGGYMGMGSFIDATFRDIMQKGWEGFNISVLFYCYMYLSLEKFKIFSILINEIMIEKFKLFGINSLKYIQNKTGLFVKNKKIKQISQELCLVNDGNKFVTNLVDKNKLDILAIGHFLLSRKDWIFENSRITSDKYKTMEQFAVPEQMCWTYQNVKVILSQQVGLNFVYETNLTTKVIKNANFKIPNTMKKTTEIDFNKDYRDWTERSNILIFINSFKFPIKCYKSWDISPIKVFSGFFICITTLIYYKKDDILLDRLIKFILGIESLYMKGIEYKIRKWEYVLPSWLNSLEEYEKSKDDFFKEVKNYSDIIIKELENPENKDKKELFDKCVEENEHMFDVVDFSPVFHLKFESLTLTSYELSNVSRNMMHEFITSYYEQNLETEGKVSIYKLEIEYMIEIKKIPNPAYDIWFEKFGMEEESEKIQKMRGPSQTIDKEIKVPQVSVEHIKSDSKPFQYLYLEKKEKELLLNYLNNFKTNKERYTKIGLPYKGGILLYGEPGCGKSSTIMAIATYLNKDVYYVDLGQVKTNDELKLLLDHIQTSSRNGGLIIFEDIDCMSSVVLKRTKQTTVTKDSLSLSFLLNVIDGSMAPEDVIFIMTTNHIEKLDPALIRPGRMDINIKLEKCTRYQLSCMFRDLYNRDVPSHILQKFPEHKFIIAEVILHLFHNIYNGETDEKLFSKFI